MGWMLRGGNLEVGDWCYGRGRAGRMGFLSFFGRGEWGGGDGEMDVVLVMVMM